MSSVSRLENDHEGTTAIEYALMAAAVAAVIVVVVFALGIMISGLFESVNAPWTAP